MLYYLPSCNFSALCPEASRRIKAYLAKKPGVTVSGCCRPLQKRLTEEDTVLTICLTCAALSREASAAQVKSVWEYLLEDDAFPWPDYGGERVTVQDCWRARENPALQQAVRACMRRMNITPVELEENLERTRFDGTWLMNPVAERNMQLAPRFFGEVQEHWTTPLPPEEQQRRMTEWASQYVTDRVAVYCNSCLSGVRMGGAGGVHLMELATRDL